MSTCSAGLAECGRRCLVQDGRGNWTCYRYETTCLEKSRRRSCHTIRHIPQSPYMRCTTPTSARSFDRIRWSLSRVHLSQSFSDSEHCDLDLETRPMSL